MQWPDAPGVPVTGWESGVAGPLCLGCQAGTTARKLGAVHYGPEDQT